MRSAHLEQLLLGLIVDDRDDARTAGLDELDVGAGDVGGRGGVVDPAAGAVPRVRDDAAVVHGGVRRRRGAGCSPRFPAHPHPDDPGRCRCCLRRRWGEEGGGKEEEGQEQAGQRRESIGNTCHRVSPACVVECVRDGCEVAGG